MNTVPCALLVEFKDLENCKRGDSIRIAGLWKTHNKNTNIAIIQYDQYKAEVDTLSIQCMPSNGDTIQCLGEVVEEATFGILRMHARIIRVVNSLDLKLYERTIRYVNDTL